MTSVVPFHGLLLKDFAADLAWDLQKCLLLGREVDMCLIMLLKLCRLKNFATNKTICRFVKFLRLVLALHMSFKRPRI